MSSIDLDEEEYRSQIMSDLSTNDLTSPMKLEKKKMFDITELLDSEEFENLEFSSTNVVDYLRIKNEQENYEESQWKSEENYLKYGSKQLSPSDYLTRTSLYNRPVAFEKDSRSWARSLLDNFKKSNQNFPCKSSSFHSTYFFPVIKNSSSFDHHIQYIEHLNECNDYPAYLEYLKENRSDLFYTLTDSMDLIDGLIGTVVSSF